jgi:hypothetical protein
MVGHLSITLGGGMKHLPRLTPSQRATRDVIVCGLLTVVFGLNLALSVWDLNYAGMVLWALLTAWGLHGLHESYRRRRTGRVHWSAISFIRKLAALSADPVMFECEGERLVVNYVLEIGLIAVMRGLPDELERARHPGEEHWETAVDVFLLPPDDRGELLAFATGELHIHPLEVEAGVEAVIEFPASLGNLRLATVEEVRLLVHQLLTGTVPLVSWVDLDDDAWAHRKVTTVDQ